MENPIESPVGDAEVSTLPVNDAVDIVESNLDNKMDEMFNTLMPEAAKATPSEENVADQSNDEVSEDAEQETSDDETPDVDNQDETNEDEVEELDAPATLEAVSLADLKENSQGIVVKGKVRSATDIEAAFGRQEKQEQARNEVETEKAQVAEEWAKLEDAKQGLEITKTISTGTKQIAEIDAIGNQLAQMKQKAIADNDSHNVTLINEKLNNLVKSRNELQSNIQKATDQRAVNAAKELSKFGFGELTTDPQRANAFKEYAMKTIPTHLVDVVNTEPSLLAVFEKARLYDKNQSAIPKGKLKVNSNRTLKGGSGNATAPKKTATVDPIQSKIDNMFK